MSLLKIIDAQSLESGRVALKFSDGRTGNVDLVNLARSDLPPVFAKLREPGNALAFQLSEGTLKWPDDLDLAPEYLYFQCFKNEVSLRDRFVAWGYLETV